MYINDVIRQVKRVFPSEFTDTEMYVWCDEVSSMLAVEDRTVYKAVRLSPSGGHILLPEGVGIENICSVEADGKRLEKSRVQTRSLTSYSTVIIVYEEPYYPIRLPKYKGDMTVSEDAAHLTLGANEFLTGDKINIINSAAIPFAENVPLLGKLPDPDNDGMWILEIADGFVPAQGQAYTLTDCTITRTVTDKTVCDAPYDSMYVDYVLAKINLYQRDTDSYNRHMTAFNSRLAAYKRWLMNRMPHGRADESKFFNVW